ncbi:MAG: sugar ABC transporter substrate-binding protein [Anaerolineae bacterium]
MGSQKERFGLITTRRRFLKMVGVAGMGLSASALLGGCQPAQAPTPTPVPAGETKKKLRVANVVGGMGVPWVPRGVDAANIIAKLLNIEVTVFDSDLSADKQYSNYQDVAAQDWDFVMIQSIATNSGLDAVQKIIDKGIPVINYDGWIADPPDKVKIHCMIKSDSVAMGEAVGHALAAAIGYKGNVVHTQGLLSHSVARERAEGFKKAMANYPDIKVIDETPGDWDATKVASIWEDLLARGVKIDAAFFHNDSMADAAAKVLENAGRLQEVKIGSIDAMPFAVENVAKGRFYVTAMNSSPRIFADALWAGYYAVIEGERGVPLLITEPSPLIFKENAEGYMWFQKHYIW